MSDVGLNANLDFSVEEALAQVDALEQRLNTATNLTLVVDPTEVVSSIDAAVAEAAPVLNPQVDTGQLTLDFDQAGSDAAPVVTPTADTAIMASEIAAAGDAVDITVPVTADTTQAEAELANLDTGAQEAAASVASTGGAAESGGKGLELFGAAAAGAEGSTHELLGTMGEAGIVFGATAAATAGLFEEAVKAAGGEDRLTQAFGSASAAVQTINVGDLNADLGTLAQQLGSTNSQIDNTVANLGIFATAGGASQQQAAQFSDTIVALAARSAALNPSLGTVSDAADRLATVFASGRTRGLVPFGISLDANSIKQEAYTETGKAAGDELSRYELATAAATLATQKYGDQLNESIAEGSKNPVIQLRALQAEFTNAAEEIGKPLIAPIFDTLRSALPLAVTLSQTFAGTAEALLPILNTVLAVIGEIPTPAISMLGTFVALGFAVQGFGAALAAAGVVSQEAFATLAPELAAAAAAFAIVTTVLNAQSDAAKKVNQAIDDTSTALSNQNATVEQNLAGLLRQRDTTGELAEVFTRAGVSFDTYAAANLRGKDASKEMTDAVLAQAEASGKGGLELAALKDGLDRLPQILNAGARETLVGALAQGQLTQAQIDGAEGTNKNADGTINFVGALNSLHGPLLAAQLAQESATKAQDADVVARQAAIDTANKEKAVLQSLGDTAPGVALALAGINTTLGSQVPGLETLAVNIGKAKLSNDQIKAIADGFGVSADQLSTFVKNVNDAIDGMNADAESKLPAVTAGFDQILKFAQGIPAALDPKALITAFQGQIKAVADFEDNISFLRQQGLDNLVGLAEKEGPQATAALVAGIKQGGPALGRQLNDTYKFATDQLSTQVPEFFQGVNTQVALATGLVGKLATDAFGATFRIEAPTQEQLQISYQKAALFGIPFAQALKDTAGGGAVAYQQAIGALPGSTQVTIDGVVQTLGAGQAPVAGAGSNLGGAAVGGFGGPVAGMTAPDSPASQLGFALQSVIGSNPNLSAVHDSGLALGLSIDAGLEDGLKAGHVGVDNAMTGMIEGAITAAKIAAGIQSPSTVFAEIGMQMGAGVVLGLDASGVPVSDAAGRLALSAVPNIPRSARGDTLTASSRDQGGAPVIIREGDLINNISTTDPFVAAAEVLRKKRSESRKLQR